MVKLFTDEEMDEKCKDYDPIPMKFAQDILHREERDDRINILNGVIKSPYRTGQAPAYVQMYANQIGAMIPISADAFMKAYNDEIDRRTIDIETQMSQDELDLQDMITDLTRLSDMITGKYSDEEQSALRESFERPSEGIPQPGTRADIEARRDAFSDPVVAAMATTTDGVRNLRNRAVPL
tara:strand:- start:192 stop:734 length:543 start_codon:yes stop_codon:yes gene_type:complete